MKITSLEKIQFSIWTRFSLYCREVTGRLDGLICLFFVKHDELD
ncbi:MAG: hypothetical protein QNJ54_21780 [Prochloraceae cyanobacterium]|nr:hypothetical protein [Prochloraceae cyanobacterium]